MVQFLSINFFSWISSIFVGFFKISRFFVSLCIMMDSWGCECMEVVVLCTGVSPGGSGTKVKLSVTDAALGTVKPCEDLIACCNFYL